MREVDLDEIAVSSVANCSHREGTPLFVANGISTCLAIVMHGYVNSTPFAAMLHWSGFTAGVNKKNRERMLDEVYSLFVNIEQKILTQLTTTENSLITINALNIIGGEKQQNDEEEKMLVSGTEKEVKILKKHASEICAELFEMHSETTIRFRNFITRNSDVIDIQVFSDGIRYQHIKECCPEQLRNGPKEFLIEINHHPSIDPENSSTCTL